MLKGLLCCCATAALTFATAGHAGTTNGNAVNDNSALVICPSGFDYNLCLISKDQSVSEKSNAEVGLRIDAPGKPRQLIEREVVETKEGNNTHKNNVERNQNHPARANSLVP